MTGLNTTARTARAETKAELSRLLVRLLAELDIAQDELARCCGVASSIVQRWCDRDRNETPSIADVVAMPRALALALLRWMAGPHDHVIVETPNVESAEELHAHLAATLTECNDVASVTLRGLADGELCAGDRADVHRETGEAIEKLTALLEATRPDPAPTRLVPRNYPTRAE